MSRMRKEKLHKKKERALADRAIIEQRIGVPSVDLCTGICETKRIEMLTDMQRFKISGKSVEQQVEDIESLDEKTKREGSHQSKQVL